MKRWFSENQTPLKLFMILSQGSSFSYINKTAHEFLRVNVCEFLRWGIKYLFTHVSFMYLYNFYGMSFVILLEMKAQILSEKFIINIPLWSVRGIIYFNSQHIIPYKHFN